MKKGTTYSEWTAQVSYLKNQATGYTKSSLMEAPVIYKKHVKTYNSLND